jgi:hypothetical protein
MLWCLVLKRQPLPFVAVSLLLVATLVPGAALRGEVLSQAGLLYELTPWNAYAPPDAPAANPLLSDPAFVFYPFLTHTVKAISSWRLPNWSTAIYAGHPFLGSFQSAVFSPFTAIALVVPLPHATVLIALAPLVVGGLGMFLYVRSLGLNLAAAWFAGTAYLLNGFSVAWMEHPLTSVVCWVPWVLRATDALVDRGGARRTAALAVLVALVIVSGHPETATKVFLLTAGYGATALVAAGSARWRLALAAYVAGALLVSIQIMPFVEYLSQSEALATRDAQPLNRFFMPAVTAIAAAVPDFFGNPARGDYLVAVNRLGGEANYAEQSIYAGIAALLLAPIGLVTRWRAWRTRFFAASAALALLLMYGAPGVLQAASAVPFFRVMILSRFGVIVIVALVVLAACAVDRLTAEHEQASGTMARTVLLGASFTLVVIWAVYLATRGWLDTAGLTGQTAFAVSIATFLVLAVAGVVLLRLRGRLSPRAFAIAISALAAVDLAVAGHRFHPTIPASQVYPELPELSAIQRDPGLFRVYGWGRALAVNAAMAYGLQDVRGWDGINPNRYTHLLDLGYLRQAAEPERHLRNPVILDLLNVKYVLADRELPLPSPRYLRVPDSRVPLYVNTRALPRAFLVDRHRVLPAEDLRRTLHDASEDLSRVALLEHDLPPADRPEPAAGLPLGTVQVRRYEDTFVEIEIDTPGRRLLVMSDAHYPGWIVRIGSRQVPILRADFALRAVPVPAGRHVVTFEYRPLSLRLGAFLSAASLAGLVAAALLDRRRAQTASTC